MDTEAQYLAGQDARTAAMEERATRPDLRHGTYAAHEADVVHEPWTVNEAIKVIEEQCVELAGSIARLDSGIEQMAKATEPVRVNLDGAPMAVGPETPPHGRASSGVVDTLLSLATFIEERRRDVDARADRLSHMAYETRVR